MDAVNRTGQTFLTFCQNCGSGSHCGGPLWKKIMDGERKWIDVEVCKHCICELCSPEVKEEKEKWRQSKYS